MDISLHIISWFRSITKLPKHCKNCGEEIEHGKTIVEYSTETGLPDTIRDEWECPSYSVYFDRDHYSRKTYRVPTDEEIQSFIGKKK